MAVWLAEGSLIPLAELCRPRRFGGGVTTAKSALPENYERA